MVNICNKNNKNNNLFFFDSLNKIKQADIFFSSCAINYTKNPIKIYNQISKLNVDYLYFTRTHLTKNNKIKFKQSSFLSENGPLPEKLKFDQIVEYTNTIINLNLFEKIFLKKYNLITKYIDEKNAFKLKSCNIDTYTYIYKKK